MTQPSPIAKSQAPAPGDKMPDGTIYAGISPDTGKAMYTISTDTPLRVSFGQARKVVAGLNGDQFHGYQDWRVPTMAEVNVLFNDRAAIGGFNLSGSRSSGWYWSSSKRHGLFQTKRFSDGYESLSYGGNADASSLRCIR